MANGNVSLTDPWHSDIPIWAKTSAFLVGTVGVPVLVTAYFMAMGAGIISSPILKNQEALVVANTGITNIQRTLADAVNAMKREVEDSHRADKHALRLQSAICLNTAQTAPQRAMCDSIINRALSLE